MVNMMDDQDKTLYKDVSNTIKTVTGCPPKLALDKISHVNFLKLRKLQKNFERVNAGSVDELQSEIYSEPDH